ncbi:PTS N-acetylmuramic acid transporter subunits IIBC [Salmonella enterica subsp. indica]|uniref:PTS system N-acetylmuramic acid-specific EIIBC component n=3 Tax=Salmonella enterica TaxID=28901 RepID=A0A5Y2QHC5_SALER|nr:PTS N-acetylmuramic acid transporter subunit IIBC [Salmonella enterica]EBH9038524.1 PTS N-acetylmuramic acid transporter subunits IIBC [Salmonella enterica subsp. indica serovar 11:b:e,n,x]EBP3211295.1 PTS N-acetylmuramic acid transporter subunit IIBC [Salmonella enterica subsp. arizonae]ECI8273731.1 PTS N-acetylmuramic acid transporter subunit IIBC [Salmonella enterica subsp. enterica]EDR2772759.1 PTS N-acetylmuramic acid transporter subunit IIBC [Salmonella enterica subsp. enterica serovar
MAKEISNDLLNAIITQVGGQGNIATCGNCMTRLRLAVHDSNQVDPAIKGLEGVKGVVLSANQVQIIFGPGKAQRAADAMNALLADSSKGVMQAADIAAKTKSQLKAKQTSGIQQFLSKFATIFTPLIPGFIAAGLLLGIATLLGTVMHVPADAQGMLPDALNFMKVFSKGLFTFLVILVGYNAAQAFGGTGVNGAIIASLFLLGYNPVATTGYFSGIQDFFGIPIDPRGNIIGVLIAAWASARIEGLIRRFMPDDLDMLLTSMLTLLITATLAYLIIMPLGGWLFEGMSWLFIHLNSNPLGCAILAGLFLVSVVFGVHQGFIPVYLALMSSQGFNSLFPILSMAGAGQVGAALALYWRAEKHSALRSQIRGAIIPGLLGVGEPLIYGVTLPRMKPFITACLGGAAGGLFIGLVAWAGLPMGLNSAFGPSGLVALPLMTSAQGILPAMAVYAGGMLISYLGGFIFTVLFGCRNVNLD